MDTTYLLPNEIKTIIALSGNRRLPDLEEQIFDDDTLTREYIIAVCGINYCPSKSEIAEEIVMYAYRTDSCRWLAAECAVARYSARAAYIYARDVIGGRWDKAESSILYSKSEANIISYAVYVMKCRWPEGEVLLSVTGWRRYIGMLANL